MQKIFVYGSFTAGMIHRSKINQAVQSASAGHIEGHCYLLPVGYPAVLATAAQPTLAPSKIYGELLSVEGPDLLFRLLDEFHGVSVLHPEKSLYFKLEVQVQTSQGVETALTYALNPAKLPAEALWIADGDWVKAMQGKPGLTQLLSPKQVEYLKKLGQIKGRGVIPYDLNLNRELMKLDLLVDKGRRLALTKLGKDLIRYLPE
jgi:gamma-glutamylcyclotransferase (GGCT)/AIG2-like uncharacterized protein YtfP